MTDPDNAPELLTAIRQIARLRRRIDQRDRRIAGLVRRISVLETALATRTLDLASLSRNVERAVTHALCNVRMIPVHGMSGSKIVEVTTTPADGAAAALGAKTP